ncbi:MAG: hypothetical protein LBS50_11010 [Prevotellaceae bacterium]|jgi:hypothetical protein|nr:hypothetical protein [Prevotellaceae bacterium]
MAEKEKTVKLRGVKFVNSTISTAKAEFVAGMHTLPAAIQQAIGDNATFLDHSIYAVKRTNNASSLELFQDSDTKQEGVCNLNGAKLNAGEYFMLTGIRLMAANYSTETVGAEYFQSIRDLGIDIANGELEIKANSKPVTSKLSCRVFATSYEGGAKALDGYYRLESPKLIAAQVPITATLRLNPTVSHGDYMLRIELMGVITARA